MTEEKEPEVTRDTWMARAHQAGAFAQLAWDKEGQSPEFTAWYEQMEKCSHRAFAAPAVSLPMPEHVPTDEEWIDGWPERVWFRNREAKESDD